MLYLYQEVNTKRGAVEMLENLVQRKDVNGNWQTIAKCEFNSQAIFIAHQLKKANPQGDYRSATSITEILHTN